MRSSRAHTFFARMEEMRFFEHIEDRLPEEFTAVYDIARVLENDEHPLAERLAPILKRQSETKELPPPAAYPVPIFTNSEEYEAGLIQSYRDVVRIYPYQFLLPDEVFDQKLAERSLWMPTPKKPMNFRYQTESDDFAPDSRKQKIYVLLDTSTSMIAHHRIHLAKAIAYVFLRQNMRELGTTFFRTFDVIIGDLRVAHDAASFEKLISAVMHIDSLGNGTAMVKALQTAVDDIRSHDDMCEAEILVITDGAVHLEKEKIEALLGNNIRLNTVRIGHEEIAPPKAYIQDQILLATTDQGRMLQKLHNLKKDVERKISITAGDQKKHHLQTELATVNAQIEKLTEQFTKKVGETYGKEIEELSTVYIQIEDIDPHAMFALTEPSIRELEEITQDVLDTISDHADAEELKQAAMLHNHLSFLLQYNQEQSAQLQQLQQQAGELKDLIEKMLDAEERAQADMSMPMNMMEQQQLSLLMNSLSQEKASFAMLLRMLFMKLKRSFLLWRQRRKYKV